MKGIWGWLEAPKTKTWCHVALCIFALMTPCFFVFGASSHPYIPIIFKKHLYYFEKLPLHIIDLDSAKGIQSVWGSRLIWHFCVQGSHPSVS